MSSIGSLPSISDKSFNVSEKSEGPKPFNFSSNVNLVSSTVFLEYSKLAAKKNYCFFSPCLLPHLSLLYAAGPESLKKVFREEFDLNNVDEQQWHDAMSKWVDTIVSNVKQIQSQMEKPFDFKLSAEHAVAVRKDCRLMLEPQKIFERAYEAQYIAFGSPQEAEIKANRWIDDKTSGEIKDLVQDLGPDLVAVLLSAALFKGSWVYPFDKAKTQKELFCNHKEEYRSLDKMYVESDEYRTGYIGDAYNIRIIELPFHGNISMYIFLPETEPAQCLDTLEKYLTKAEITRFFTHGGYQKLYQTESLTVALPRIKLSEKDNLLEVLSEWRLIEEIKKADLAGTLVESEFPVVVGQMVAQTNLVVDEEGAAIVAAMYTACYQESCPPAPFDVNRPFAFAFFDKTTGSILGMGGISDLPGEAPSEQELKQIRRYYW